MVKKRMRILFLLFVSAACVGAAALHGASPVILENEKDMDHILISDEQVPLANAPGTSVDWENTLTEAQLTEVQEVLQLVNEARADAGVSPLALDPMLCKAAQVRATECITTFSHTRPDGTAYSTALSEQGVSASYIGENVATGYQNAQAVVSGWINSEGHRANILNGNYKHIGIGMAENAGTIYRGYSWSQLFTD